MNFNRLSLAHAQLAKNVINATGTLMLGFLVGGTRPILSQAQAIDNGYILGLLEAKDKTEPAESVAFLRLAELGHIQVVLHDNPPLLDAPNRLTLINAFASDLQRGPNFRLSGWPEIDSDYERRSAIADCLVRVSDKAIALREIGNIAGNVIEKRASALFEFNDRLLVGGRAFSLSNPTAADSYGRRMKEQLQRLLNTTQEVALFNLSSWLLREYRIIRDSNVANGTPSFSDVPLNLNTRSGWLVLLDEHLKNHPDSADSVRTVRSLVNGTMHKVIAASLRSTGSEIEMPDPDTAETFAEASPENDIAINRLVTLASDRRQSEWLSWDRVLTLRDELDNITSRPSERLEVLIQRHKDYITRQKIEKETSLISVAVGGSLGVLGGTADSLISGPGGVVPAAIGSAIGMLTVIAGQALKNVGSLQRILKNYYDRKWEELASRWEASISEGTTSWQDEV